MRPPEGGAAGTCLPCLTAFPRNDGLRLCGGSIVRSFVIDAAGVQEGKLAVEAFTEIFLIF